MTFEENPFRVLQVSIYATKATINERADELSFEDPDREELFEQARTILTNPKKRIAAEVQWFVGKGIFASDSIFPWLATIDKNFSAQKPEELRKKINKARTESKLPAIEDVSEIKTELKNVRYEIRKMIQDELHIANHKVRVNFANRFAEEVLAEKSFGIVVEDFFELYSLEMKPFLEKTANQITALLSKIKINAHPKFLDELDYSIKEFCYARKPLDKFSLITGLVDLDDSESVCRDVRNAAIDLFNEKNLIDEPLRIIRMLEQNFSHLPTLGKLIREDIKFLEEAKARRPTQTFQDAMTEFGVIMKSTEQGLHLEKGFEQVNLEFYEKVFKPRYEGMIKRLMIRRDTKLEEWRLLNIAASMIYLRMGSALTWTRRADLALEMFQASLVYAEASGDSELIARAKKDVIEWSEVNRQIAANTSRGSSGCLSVIAAICLVLWLVL